MRTQRKQAGFTLIEIMAVVIVIGLLSTLVVLNIADRVDEARHSTAKTQIDRLAGALDMYRMDNARYPTSEQGLEALVAKPGSPPEPKRYPPGGYVKQDIPMDPWGNPYEYRSPGDRNPRSFDLWSWGADGQPGGEGNDADIGNWGDAAYEG